MYYDAAGADYISTPSFAIPDTGILTIEAWMKSKLDVAKFQGIISDAAQADTIGFLWLHRYINSNGIM